MRYPISLKAVKEIDQVIIECVHYSSKVSLKDCKENHKEIMDQLIGRRPRVFIQ